MTLAIAVTSRSLTPSIGIVSIMVQAGHISGMVHDGTTLGMDLGMVLGTTLGMILGMVLGMTHSTPSTLLMATTGGITLGIIQEAITLLTHTSQTWVM